MRLMQFYVVHSLRDMWRNQGRTIFALICVATGVAAVVALRTLAFMIGDELTSNLAEVNRGDIRIYASDGVPDLVELSKQRESVFSHEAESVIRDWAESESVELTLGRMNDLRQVRPVFGGERTSKALLTLWIEPEKYPFYSTIMLSDPQGATLGDVLGKTANETDMLAAATLPKLGALGTLLAQPVQPVSAAWSTYPAYLASHPRPVVISSRLTREAGLGLAMGDVIRLGTSDALYVVEGIVPSSAESILSTPQTVFLDFLYLPISDLPFVGERMLADQIFVKVPYGNDTESAESNLLKYLFASFGDGTDFREELNRATVPELEEDNEEVAGVIDDVILVLGLSSLLIGGIGIINTMLVVVNRRTLEIAVLKTLGLKGYKVTFLFLVEAFLLGLIGSAAGSALGIVLSYIIRGVGEEALTLTLQWRIYPEAILSGVFLGMVMTVLFGFLPTLIAGQVRPAIVLRPNEARMPAAGLLQILATLVVMITVLGLMINSIIEGSIYYGPIYMIAGAGALVGVFAGVIVANTRLGKPIPDYYRFRLARRFDQLDGWITGATGRLVAWVPVARWRGLSLSERGRRAVTGMLRGLRQFMLLYGAVAVAGVLASAVMLIASEIWKPFGIGDTKPAGHIFDAAQQGDVAWVLAWLALLGVLGFLIRWLARGFVSVIALGSVGTTLGGSIGWLIGAGLEAMLAGSEVWRFLSEISTGLIVVEAALVILGAVYVGYWLLMWLFGKMPVVGMMGLISLTIVGIVVGLAFALASQGIIALVFVVLVMLGIGGLWLGGRYGVWQADRLPASQQTVETARQAAGGVSVVLLGVVLLVGGFWLVDALGSSAWFIVLGAGVGFFVFWRFFQRRYSVDGRLILREMSGRRGRVASTLLGLSVGVAGLSIVSLTTGAASHLLEVQLGESTEGDLVIADPGALHKDDLQEVLVEAEGIERYTQFTSYGATLLKVNGETIEPPRGPHGTDEQDDPRENSPFEADEKGISVSVSLREDLDKLPDYEMAAGRSLDMDDVGEHYIMLRESFITEEYGISSGDRLFFVFTNGPGDEDDVSVQFRVIGVISRSSEQTGLEEFGNLFVIPPETLPDTVRPEALITVVTMDTSSDRYMDQMLVSVSEIGVFALEVSDITRWIQDLINQLRAIPTLVAWLALVAGTAIIANTVALATQERRRQIGVMKAVGLKGRRVLWMLMVENGLIGLIAGLIGSAVGLVITVVMVLAAQSPSELHETIEFSTIGWLILMSIGVAVAAATFSAWTAASEKPMNVLRYE